MNESMQHLLLKVQPHVGKDTPKKAANLTTFVLLVILAWVLGRLAWQWVTPEPVAPPQVNSSSFSVRNASSPAYQLDKLVNRHFFGRYNEAAPVVKKEEAVIDAPRTKLNLTLVGLVASNDASRGLAVIANRGKQKTYGVGEAIEGTRVILRQVLIDRVILRNNGRDEALMLAGVDYNERNKSHAAPVQAKKTRTPSQGGGDFSAIKAEILNNPQALLKYITLSQEQNQDGLIGYRIGPGSDKRFFEQAGLENGDIAVRINGADLTNPAEMNRIWQSLSDSSEISLTVQRNGQLHDIYISL